MSFQRFNQKTIIYIIIALTNLSNLAVHTTYYLYLTRELGLSNSASLGLDAPTFITNIIFEVPTGIWGDRFGYKKSFLVSVGLNILASIFYFIGGSYFILVIGSIVFGLGLAFASGSFDALCIENNEKDLKNFYVNKQVIIRVSTIIAPILAYFLASITSFRSIYILDILLKLSIFLFTFKFLYESVNLKKDLTGGLSYLLHGWKEVLNTVRESKYLKLQAIASFIWGFSVPTYATTSSVLALSGNASLNGIIYSITSATGLATVVIAKKIKNTRFMYWASFMWYVVFSTLIGIFIGKEIVLPLFVIACLFSSTHEIIYDTFFNSQLKKNKAGVLSLFALFPRISNILAVFISGYISDHLGLGPLWIFTGVLLSIVGVFLYIESRLIIFPKSIESNME